jgi:hypothetical protein
MTPLDAETEFPAAFFPKLSQRIIPMAPENSAGTQDRLQAILGMALETAEKNIEPAKNVGETTEVESGIDTIVNPATRRNPRSPVFEVEGPLPILPVAEKAAFPKYSEIKNSTADAEIVQPNTETGRFEATIPDSRRGISPGLEWYPANSKAGLEGNLPVSDNSGSLKDVPACETPERITVAANEGAGNAGSHAGGDNSQNTSGAPMLTQNKSENSRMDLEKMRTPAADRQQEIASQYQMSGSARPTDTSSPTVSARSEVAVAQPKEFLVQLAERIQVQVREGREEIRIQLKPDSLGHLEIRAESTANGVVARIMAESGTVKNYLEANLHLLQQSLQDQGLKIDRIQVSVQDNSGSSSSSGYAAQSGHSGSGYHGRETDRFSESSASLVRSQPEELSVDPVTWIAINPSTRFHTIA